MVKWTVDVEYDWGGRTNGTKGLTEGLPKIIQAFAGAGIKALFFISTELLPENEGIVKAIQDAGHEIGSHGHFHTSYRYKHLSEADKKLSEKILAPYKPLSQESIRYRAPKFNYGKCGEFYSHRKSHVSLLKYTWFGRKIKGETIFYLHPFDIVRGSNPPNLFCRLWYSHPERAYETFTNLVRRYPGDNRLGENN